MQFTIVDGGVAVITILSGLLAYSRGFTREIFAIGGWIVAALAAFYLAPLVEPLIRELPAVGDFFRSNCLISMIAAFSLVVAAGLLVLSVFTPIFSAAVLDSPLAPVDRVLGFLFGIVRAGVLLAVGYLIYDSLSGGSTWAPLQNAASKGLLDQASDVLNQYRPEELPSWFRERIDALMAPCSGDVPAPEPTGPAADTGTGTNAPNIQTAPTSDQSN